MPRSLYLAQFRVIDAEQFVDAGFWDKVFRFRGQPDASKRHAVPTPGKRDNLGTPFRRDYHIPAATSTASTAESNGWFICVYLRLKTPFIHFQSKHVRPGVVAR